jgi:hypothetical protein
MVTAALRSALRPLARRAYATSTLGFAREVEGFVGAVGNTPLVSSELHPTVPCSILHATARAGRVLTPIDPPQPLVRGDGCEHPRQGRVHVPRRVYQGPRGALPGAGGRGEGPDPTGRDGRGRYRGKHGYRPRPCVQVKGLQLRDLHARHAESGKD